MEDHRQTPQQATSRAASVAKAIAEEARRRNDWQEAERFERIATAADARFRQFAQPM